MPQTQSSLSLYVDKDTPGAWIVRDREGEFWMVHPGESAWDNRQPYVLSMDAQLVPVPGHYAYMLGIAG